MSVGRFINWLEGKLDDIYDWFFGPDEATETKQEEAEEHARL